MAGNWGPFNDFGVFDGNGDRDSLGRPPERRYEADLELHVRAPYQRAHHAPLGIAYGSYGAPGTLLVHPDTRQQVNGQPGGASQAASSSSTSEPIASAGDFQSRVCIVRTSPPGPLGDVRVSTGIYFGGGFLVTPAHSLVDGPHLLSCEALDNSWHWDEFEHRVAFTRFPGGAGSSFGDIAFVLGGRNGTDVYGRHVPDEGTATMGGFANLSAPDTVAAVLRSMQPVKVLVVVCSATGTTELREATVQRLTTELAAAVEGHGTNEVLDRLPEAFFLTSSNGDAFVAGCSGSPIVLAGNAIGVIMWAKGIHAVATPLSSTLLADIRYLHNWTTTRRRTMDTFRLTSSIRARDALELRADIEATFCSLFELHSWIIYMNAVHGARATEIPLFVTAVNMCGDLHHLLHGPQLEATPVVLTEFGRLVGPFGDPSSAVFEDLNCIVPSSDILAATDVLRRDDLGLVAKVTPQHALWPFVWTMAHHVYDYSATEEEIGGSNLATVYSEVQDGVRHFNYDAFAHFQVRFNDSDDSPTPDEAKTLFDGLQFADRLLEAEIIDYTSEVVRKEAVGTKKNKLKKYPSIEPLLEKYWRDRLSKFAEKKDIGVHIHLAAVGDPPSDEQTENLALNGTDSMMPSRIGVTFETVSGKTFASEVLWEGSRAANDEEMRLAFEVDLRASLKQDGLIRAFALAHPDTNILDLMVATYVAVLRRCVHNARNCLAVYASKRWAEAQAEAGLRGCSLADGFIATCTPRHCTHVDADGDTSGTKAKRNAGAVCVERSRLGV